MPTFPRLAHVFVDESKARGYYIAAAAVAPGDSTSISKELRALTRRGQSRIHFKSESDSARRSLIARMCELSVDVQVYAVRGSTHTEARTMCLDALVDDLVSSGASRLCLERDASVEAADRRLIRSALVRNGAVDSLAYQHVSPNEQPILWISDAVAWCQQAGGEWPRRAERLISGVRRLG